MLATLGTHIRVWELECEEEPFGAGRGLGPGKGPGSSAEHPSRVQSCTPAVCQGLETELEGSQ